MVYIVKNTQYIVRGANVILPARIRLSLIHHFVKSIKRDVLEKHHCQDPRFRLMIPTINIQESKNHTIVSCMRLITRICLKKGNAH
jgi:hypothetical protein